MTKMALRKVAVSAAAILTPLLFATGCGNSLIVLHPSGPVGRGEANLIWLSFGLTMIVIIPVFILLAFIVIRYRDKPGYKGKYLPEWSENRTLEIIWWGIPILIIGTLGVATAREIHAVANPPESNVKPITIEVTSLNWKWLFQYPGQNIATVNYCNIPAGRPVQFVLTSDAPMNSFWVPQLGGQEYTMPGMALNLWLQADVPGNYYGHGANFSGEGFEKMEFHVIAQSDSDFNAWVNQIKHSSPALTATGYQNLIKPSVVSASSYSSYPADSFMNTLMQDGGGYMPGQMQALKALDVSSQMSMSTN